MGKRGDFRQRCRGMRKARQAKMVQSFLRRISLPPLGWTKGMKVAVLAAKEMGVHHDDRRESTIRGRCEGSVYAELGAGGEVKQ